MPTTVNFGIDNLPAADRGRVGLVTNDAATTAGGTASRAALLSRGWNLVRLFSPEHGLTATAPDGAAVADGADALTGLPVVSLYGDRVRPPLQLLEDLDAVLFDIPDIGARFYTYIWTLSQVLEACAQARRPLIVLDRPNPLGGLLSDAEGPMLDESFASTFVGRWSIPIRHSLTVGELATLWNAQRRIGASVTVVKCSGWQRRMHWPDTGLPFVPTSPAIRCYESALLYPGTCLLEGTNLSEGRGTRWPFQLAGAPWLASAEVANELNAAGLSGVRFVTEDFVPADRQFSGARCRGVRIEVTDAKRVRPVAVGLSLIAAIARRHAKEFEWHRYPTAVNRAGEGHFDRLIGVAGVRDSVDRGSLGISALCGCASWTGMVEPFLLYQ